MVSVIHAFFCLAITDLCVADSLNDLRTKISEHELTYAQRKRELKFKLQLNQEVEELEKVDDMAGAMDDEEIGQVDLDNFGIGRNKSIKTSKETDSKQDGGTVFGMSMADQKFMAKFQEDKEIERE